MAVTIVSMLAMTSSAAFSAEGNGVVNFSGRVVNTPCGISTETATQDIIFNEISKAFLSKDGTSEVKNLNIGLVNCDLSAPEGSPEGSSAYKSVSVTFTGATNGINNTELSTVGGTGAAIVIADAGGKPLELNSVTGNKVAIEPGDNMLRYVTWVKKGTGASIKEGDFTAVANFKLSYE